MAASSNHLVAIRLAANSYRPRRRAAGRLQALSGPGRRLGALLCAGALGSILIGGSVQAAPAKSDGAAATLTLQGDELGRYEVIPRKQMMTYRVQGPGVLFLYLLNHRTVRRSAPTQMRLTLDGEVLERIELGCEPAPGRFKGQAKLLPCTRTTRDVVVPRGEHVVGLKLLRTRVGASVHAIFTPSSLPGSAGEANEPPLVAVPGGGDAASLSSEDVTEAMPARDPSSAEASVAPSPSASDEPPLELAPPSETLELTPIETSSDEKITAEAAPPGFGDALLEPLPLSLLAGAAVLGGASLYFGLEMSSDYGAYNDGGTPQTELPALEASGDDNKLLMFAFGGAALLSAGAAFVVAATSGGAAADSPQTSAGFGVGCAGNGCAALYRWSWP